VGSHRAPGAPDGAASAAASKSSPGHRTRSIVASLPGAPAARWRSYRARRHDVNAKFGSSAAAAPTVASGAPALGSGRSRRTPLAVALAY